MIPQNSIEIRKYKPTNDEAFVYSTWLKSYKYDSYFAKRIRHSIFFNGHKNVIKHLLAKPNVDVFIASPKEDPDTILGYLVCEIKDKPVVHYVYVKDVFKRMGIATALFNHAGINPKEMTFTHWTMAVDEFMHKWDDMKYDPYAL